MISSDEESVDSLSLDFQTSKHPSRKRPVSKSPVKATARSAPRPLPQLAQLVPSTELSMSRWNANNKENIVSFNVNNPPYEPVQSVAFASKVAPHTHTHTHAHTSLSVEDLQKSQAMCDEWARSVRHKLDRDAQAQLGHKERERLIKSEIDTSKDCLLEHVVVSEERLKQELLDQQKRYEHLLAERDQQRDRLLEEKERHCAALRRSAEEREREHKEALAKKDKLYIDQLTAMEQKHREEMDQLLQQHRAQLKKIQQQLQQDEELRKLTERARIEAKEKEVIERYEKKMKKYAKKLEEIMESYQQKELRSSGALEEARREILRMQANSEAKEQTLREEMLLKDKRLIAIQKRLDSVDDLARVAQTWRETAKDLASHVVRACATVEDLPPELWSATTPGLFTTVWDDLQKLKSASLPSNMRPRDQEEIADTYARKRKEYVMASRALLSKCLKHSKIIHERIKAEVLITSPTS